MSWWSSKTKYLRPQAGPYRPPAQSSIPSPPVRSRPPRPIEWGASPPTNASLRARPIRRPAGSRQRYGIPSKCRTTRHVSKTFACPFLCAAPRFMCKSSMHSRRRTASLCQRFRPIYRPGPPPALRWHVAFRTQMDEAGMIFSRRKIFETSGRVARLRNFCSAFKTKSRSLDFARDDMVENLPEESA